MSIIIIRDLPPIEAPELAVPGDHRKDCCRNPANLEYYEIDLERGFTVKRCRHCGCRHFEINADPGYVGIEGKKIG
jgi:hypothetical protein